MLKKTLVTLSLILCVIAFGTTAAYSSGYPVAALGSISDSSQPSTPISIIVLGKFDSGPAGFTQSEAETISQTVMSLLSGLLPTSGFTILTPNQLASTAFADADAAKSFVANNYAAAGIDVFAFLDIKKAPAVSQAAGQNIRIDLYVSGLLGPSEMYIASVETALSYVQLLGGF
ncbi:MAG: hypothetical protein M0Z67_05065 [Nitrospiraceae bacterium]|nr:hypothetical protein [Nitrospiraceae bacterium]